MSVIEGGRREEEARRSSGCSTKNKNPTRQCGEQKKRDEDANTSPPHAETCLSASRLKTSHRLTANEEVGNDIGCYLGYNPVAKRCDDYSLACGALSIGKALGDKTATHCERRRLKSHRCILLRLFWSRRCLQAQCRQGPGFGAASLPRKMQASSPKYRDCRAKCKQTAPSPTGTPERTLCPCRAPSAAPAMRNASR